MVVTPYLVFLAGLIGLLVAGHLVVRAASILGARFGLSPMVIGLTIVAAGTSAPELAVVGQSVAAGDSELAVGSIIGSNIANVLLVLGIAATIGTISVASRAVRVDIPVMIAASSLFLVFALDNSIARLESAVLVAGVVAFVVWTLRSSGDDPSGAGSEDLGAASQAPLAWIVGSLALGVGGLAVAARFVVSGAEDIAVDLGMPELIVGLTVVALGTSAPEIVTTIIAAAQGRRDLAVGNAVGSNIFNILLVLGVIGVFAPGGIDVSPDALELDLPVLLAAAVACLPIVAWDHKLDRWEGAVFVAYYAAYVAFLVLDATGHRAKDPFALVMWVFVMPLTALTAAVIVWRERERHRQAPSRRRRTSQDRLS